MEKIVVLNQGESAEYVNNVLTIKLGEKVVNKEIFHPLISFKILDNKIILKSKKDDKKNKRLLNTFTSHVNNLVKGIREVFVYELKIVSSHFPMDVKIEGEELIIKNFLGERKPRVARIMKDSEVKINSDVIQVTSSNIESAGQTAASIESSTKITKRDRRRFQDGIYITKKAGKEI